MTTTDDLAEQLRCEPIANGFRLTTTPDYVIEVHRMLFNWRLVVLLPDQASTIEHGYCFFGTDLTALARAVAAGHTWTDPLNTDPPDYDKKAF